jgi:beta-glucanase (GH16 family)
MNTLPPLLALGLLALSARGTEPEDQIPPAPDGKAWKLIWHDEFDGDRLDESKWEPRPDGKRKGGWWSRKAISLDDGHLVITTFMDGDRPTDGCVWTKGKFQHSFGYYVARAKFQKEPGHWSAFWMNGDAIRKVGDGGRDGTEIDIVDMVSPSVKQAQIAPHWYVLKAVLA